jgi:penicillin-binding protein 1A
VPKVEGALVALDPHTGRVLAMSGGWDYHLSEFNRATQAMRQPGSAFKPVVYLCAMEAGYTPSSVVIDAPVSYSQGEGLPPWTPANYSNRFYGPTTLRVGLEQSRNVMTVRLAEQIGMDKVADCAQRLGVNHIEPHLPYALGAGETTLLRLTAAYGMIVNGGRRIEPTLIDRIQDRYGRIIFRHHQRQCPECQGVAWEDQPVPEPTDPSEAVTDAMSAYQLVTMLEGVVERGTGSRARLEGRPLGGKTGTSNDAKDVWFVGFSPDLAVGVFVGYDDPQSLGDHAAGGTIAAPIFGDFVAHVLANEPAIPFRTPPGIRMVRVDAATGRLTSAGNPRMILEAFKPGTAPPQPGEGRSAGTSGLAPDIGTGGLY